MQTWITFSGRSGHASVPANAENPNYHLATFLARLTEGQDQLRSHPLLGPTTIAPTIIEVDTTSPNVTPAWTRIMLDCRTASESQRSLHAFYAGLAAGLPFSLADIWQADSREADKPIYGYYTDPQSDVAQQVKAAIAAGTGREPQFISYQFATDGRLIAPYDIPIVGFAPGKEDQAHTADESIAIAKMEEALRGYISLLRQF